MGSETFLLKLQLLPQIRITSCHDILWSWSYITHFVFQFLANCI